MRFKKSLVVTVTLPEPAPVYSQFADCEETPNILSLLPSLRGRASFLFQSRTIPSPLALRETSIEWLRIATSSYVSPSDL